MNRVAADGRVGPPRTYGSLTPPILQILSRDDSIRYHTRPRLAGVGLARLPVPFNIFLARFTFSITDISVHNLRGQSTFLCCRINTFGQRLQSRKVKQIRNALSLRCRGGVR